MDLPAYRHSAESFLSALTREFYEHYAGLKDTYQIEPIYARHTSLFELAEVENLRARLDDAATGSEGQRATRMLLDFAVEGYIGQATKETEAELARREANLLIEAGGEQIGFRESAVRQANEPDPGRRAEIEGAQLEAIDAHLNPLYEDLVGTQHHVVRELGYGSYREMCVQCKGFDLDGLHAQTSAFTTRTYSSYRTIIDEQAREVLGFGLADVRRSDMSRFDRAPELDPQFPAAGLVASFEETMRGLGIDLRSQRGVRLDVEPRARKSPRAFCAPVCVPGEVYLVISPVGGRDDFGALFHEGGHTEHYANVDPALPFEFRYLGDNAITEAFAFLFMHLVENPEWLARRLGVEDAERIAAHARAQRLIYLRRYGAKLAYELELHGPGRSLNGMADRYAALLGAALAIDWPRQTFLADVDPGFYCACYLRAWALETHVRSYLREQFGPAWFESAAAGAALRSLWRQGQRLTPDELLGGLTGRRLEFGVLMEDLGL